METGNQQAKHNEILARIQPFIDEGLIRVIASTEHLLICNVSDRHYVVLSGVMHDGDDVGVAILPRHIRKLLEDEQYWKRYVDWLGDGLMNATMYVSARNLEVMRNWKRETDEKGPGRDISVRFERKLGVRDAQGKPIP